MKLTDALPNTPAVLPLQQSPEYADALRDMGCRARFHTIRDSGDRRIGQVVLVSRRLGKLGAVRFTSMGPVWSAGVGAGARVAALRMLRAHGMLLANAAEGDETCYANAGYCRLLSPAQVARLPLTPDWLSRASGKWRNQLRHGRAHAPSPVQSRSFDAAADLWLLHMAQRMARKRGYRDLPPAFTLSFARTHPGAARIFLLRDCADVVAAVLILRHGRAATYHIGWSSPAGRAYNAHRLLLAEASDWLRERGCKRLDLGTIDTVGAPGLARFKLGMGARAVALGGSWGALPLLRAARIRRQSAA